MFKTWTIQVLSKGAFTLSESGKKISIAKQYNAVSDQSESGVAFAHGTRMRAFLQSVSLSLSVNTA